MLRWSYRRKQKVLQFPCNISFKLIFAELNLHLFWGQKSIIKLEYSEKKVDVYLEK